MSTPPSNPNTLGRPLIILALLTYGLYIGTTDSMGRQSADLFAMWLAGDFMAMGRLDQIYPANVDLFDMTTPSEWWPYVQATDPDARVFPYVYPPIWAKLVSWLTPITTFTTFDAVFLAIHQVLLIATTYLAGKMCGFRGQMAWMFCAVTFLALVLTMPIGIALTENQPQILVSFLIVFAFERAQFNAPRAAGLLLALAAAIKVYPVLFVVIFAAWRNWTAFWSFAIAGAALGLTSIALTGWALHADYLHMLGLLSKSVIVTNFSFSADAFFAGTFRADDLIHVNQPSTAAQGVGWAAIGKGPLWHAISSTAQLAAIALVLFLAARRPHDPLILPVAVCLFALASPLSWAYTYLPAYVFLGALFTRLGALGWVLCAAIIVFFHPLVAAQTLYQDSWSLWSFSLGGIALTALMLIFFLWTLLKPAPAPILPT